MHFHPPPTPARYNNHASPLHNLIIIIVIPSHRPPGPHHTTIVYIPFTQSKAHMHGGGGGVPPESIAPWIILSVTLSLELVGIQCSLFFITNYGEIKSKSKPKRYRNFFIH